MAKYFVPLEFICPCCGALPTDGMDELLVSMLDVLRHRVGAPLLVTSGYRCAAHNIAVGGAASSQHRLGTAADIIVPDGWSVDSFVDLARGFGVEGVGRYYDQGFVHIDMRGSLADW